MMITKEEFLQHMECGLKRAKWIRESWWRLQSNTDNSLNDWDYNQTKCTEEQLLEVGACCAIGAAALSQKMTPKKYVLEYLGMYASKDIVYTNDVSVTVAEAIKNIGELEIWNAAK